MEAIISSREPMIPSRPGIGMEMFCCANVCAPVHKRAEVGNWARTAKVCLLFICLQITVQWEAACGCWTVLTLRNASRGFRVLLGLIFPNQSRRVVGAPRNKQQDLVSKAWFCCSLCCPFPARHEDVAASCLPDCTQLADRSLQGREVWTRKSPRMGWPFTTVATWSLWKCLAVALREQN